MLDLEAKQAIADLTEAVLSLRPLTGRLAQPVPVRALRSGIRPVLDRVGSRLGAPALTPAGRSADATEAAFIGVVSDRLDLAALPPTLDQVPRGQLPEVDRVVDVAVEHDFDTFCEAVTVRGTDGTRFPAYAAGPRDAPGLVIASACGMPARLAERWMRHFAADHRVLTWESRGLFGDVEDFDGDVGVAAQADDLIAVMDHFEIRTSHVAGLCGGAVIAVEAAARNPARIRSLSLWHGDYDLGPDAPKTDHQRNLQALMGMATGSRISAAGIHAVLCQAMLDAAPPDLAHLVLYPYATAELLFRYCQLNGAIMGVDLRARLAEVSQPAVVVTSADDRTAHPDGSRLAARLMPAATLVVKPHGDHLSVFRGSPDLLAEASRLVTQVDVD